MRILSVGPLNVNDGNNTSMQRSRCLKELASNYDELDISNYVNLKYRIIRKLITWGFLLRLPDNVSANKRLINYVENRRFDLIWIDKGNIISAKTLNRIKKIQPDVKIVHYMIDDFMNPEHKTHQIIETIPIYDYYIVNRLINIDELKSYGCKNPIFQFMGYQEKYHYPRKITNSDRVRLGGDVGFIGTYEKERSDSICFLADNKVNVRVFGNGWSHLKSYSPFLLIEEKALYGEDFCKAFQCFKVNLGFVRKKSRDFHTTRSTEIPACGGFMIAERTKEHSKLFIDQKEAVFFSNDEELLKKCQFFLESDKEREEIAKNGHQKCANLGLSYENQIKVFINKIFEK